LNIKIVSVAEVAPIYAGSEGNIPKKAFNIGVTQKKKRQPAKKSIKDKEKVQLKSATKKRKSSKKDDENEDNNEDKEEDNKLPPKKYKVGSLKTLKKAVSAPKITKKKHQKRLKNFQE
jgi:phenylalanyl-tRNA synthetase alpha subunit